MIMVRARGAVVEGILRIEGSVKHCPNSVTVFGERLPCGTGCALFSTVLNEKKGIITAAQLACCDIQWTFV